MDGYVSKPVRPEELFRELERLVPSAGRRPPPKPQESGVLRSKSLEDPALVRELVSLFLGELPAQLKALETAVERGEASPIHQAAHHIKGALSNFGVAPAVAAMEVLDTLGRDGNLEEAGENLERLRACLRELREVLTPLADPGLTPEKRPESS
jgi:HPt (histidine-containing phosphotransfer) domain-containing protein